MLYGKLKLRTVLDISELYTIHYFEYYHNYCFLGEQHNFWEFLYADRGELLITAGEKQFTIHQGQMVVHPPQEFHSVASLSETASNAIVVSFESDCAELYALGGHVFTLGGRERSLLSSIVEEARSAFASDLSDPDYNRPIPGENETTTSSQRDPNYSRLLRKEGETPYGGEQLILLYVQQLLIQLIRRVRSDARSTQEKSRTGGSAPFDAAARFIERNLDGEFDLNALCAHAGVSPSQLERLCRQSTGKSVTQYVRAQRIERARALIREGHMNMSGVAAATGFSSVGYFSRTFRAVEGMSPSEYLRSVRSLAERPLILEKRSGDDLQGGETVL